MSSQEVERPYTRADVERLHGTVRVWCETSEPDLEQAERFAATIHDEFPDQTTALSGSTEESQFQTR